MDIKQANETDKPVWQKSVDYVLDYKMDYPSPDALWELGDRISKDASLASVYKWNMSRNVAIPEEIKSSE